MRFLAWLLVFTWYLSIDLILGKISTQVLSGAVDTRQTVLCINDNFAKVNFKWRFAFGQTGMAWNYTPARPSLPVKAGGNYCRTGAGRKQMQIIGCFVREMPQQRNYVVYPSREAWSSAKASLWVGGRHKVVARTGVWVNWLRWMEWREMVLHWAKGHLAIDIQPNNKEKKMGPQSL